MKSLVWQQEKWGDEKQKHCDFTPLCNFCHFFLSLHGKRLPTFNSRAMESTKFNGSYQTYSYFHKSLKPSEMCWCHVDSFMYLDRWKWRFIVLQGCGPRNDDNKWRNLLWMWMFESKEATLKKFKVVWTWPIVTMMVTSWVHPEQRRCRIRTRS